MAERNASNQGLHNASKAKNDEFYTQLSDIEKEIGHYKEHFKGKTVFCNCDDPRVSNFFHYFSYNFEFLGLKKLITTCYKSQSADIFSENASEQAIYLEYEGEKDGGRVPTVEQIGIKPLKGDGDFRSPEVIELLKEADIVVTNPPFSLFREYISQLMEYDKKFLVIGNINAITYKEIFHLIKQDKAWLGINMGRGISGFIVPNHYELYGSEARIDDSGRRIVSTNNCLWLTNLDYPQRHEDLILYKTYKGNEQEYPKYDNYNAINIDKTKEIPVDYTGAMGVPITFLDKYNPEQFEVIALGIIGSVDFSCNKKMEILDKNGQPTGKFTWNAKGTLYRKYNSETDKTAAFKDCETGDLYSSIYARILIRNKRVGGV
jgi:hypothetical protein